MTQSPSGGVQPPIGSNPTRLWLILAVSFVAIFAILRGANRTASTGMPADFAWKVTDLQGRPVDLMQFRGKPIFLNVWATWCPPCVKEMPSIARLAANPRLNDVAFLCISEDEGVDEVERFFASGKPPMTILHSQGERPSVFVTDGIPATYVIAPDGRIVLAEVGMKAWDDEETVVLLEGLLRETK